MDLLAIGARTGCGSNSPETDSETRIRTLRSAAGAKTSTAGNCDEGTPSDCTMCSLFLNLNSSWNKGWERPVPAAVIPAAQVVVAFIGPKTSVACLVNLWVNQRA